MPDLADQITEVLRGHGPMMLAGLSEQLGTTTAKVMDALRELVNSQVVQVATPRWGGPGTGLLVQINPACLPPPALDSISIPAGLLSHP